MTKDDFIIVENDRIRINWDFVLSIDEFKLLSKTWQNPKWHFEHDVLTHTKYVTNLSLEMFGNFNDRVCKIFLILALFHDVGKGVCTRFNVDKMSWSSKNHEMESDIILRRLLAEDEDLEIISFFVRNHMKPLKIFETYDSKEEIINEVCKIQEETDNELRTIDNLIKFKRCDCLGAIMQAEDGWREKLEMLKEISLKL